MGGNPTWLKAGLGEARSGEAGRGMESSIVRDKQGLIVGQVEDRIFVKRVYGSRHMLHKPMAWSIDADIFDRVIIPNCYSIHIVDRETGTTYMVTTKTFQENKQTLDRGHGKQYFLELVHWKVQKGG